MRQIDKKKKKDKVAAVLMLCFCLIALTSIFTIKASINKISESAEDVPVTKRPLRSRRKTNRPPGRKRRRQKRIPRQHRRRFPPSTAETGRKLSKTSLHARWI